MKRIMIFTLYLSMTVFPVCALGAVPVAGDIDNTPGITMQDAIMALQVLAGMRPDGIRANYSASGADVNNDGQIGMAEAIYIFQDMANLRSTALQTIDVHAHAWTSSSSASAQQLLNVMTANSISKTILMQPPMPGYQNTDLSSGMRDFFLSLGSSFLYMYGGAELQPLLYATGHAGQITLAELYPNGGATMTQSEVDTLNAIAADTTKTYTNVFKARAIAAAESGKYCGFGELGPLHYSLRPGQPYMVYKVDTPGMLWLSNLAAQHNMVLDVHLEATATTLTEFATLLAYNAQTKIIWDHAGWSNSGLASAAVFSQMLADHPNLYLNLKMRDASNLSAGSPTDSNGNLKDEWRTLLTTYADRIMVGTDAKYWDNTSITIADQLAGCYTLLDNMLKQLPVDTAQKIRNGTAKILFGLTQ